MSTDASKKDTCKIGATELSGYRTRLPGITESITKRVPIILRKLKLSFFPEGGDLIAGLPSRVYFSAQNLIDKPPDSPQRMIGRNPVFHVNIREKLLCLFRSTAHRKSLRLAAHTESHYNSKIEEFFSSLLGSVEIQDSQIR